MALRIQPLHVGTVSGISQAQLTYQRGYTEKTDFVAFMFLITGGEHAVLVDTGTGPPDQVLRDHGLALERPPEQEPLAALESAGLTARDIGTVVNTHLHWDHCANNDLFPEAEVLVQRAELAYAVDPLEPNRKSYERLPGQAPAWMRAFTSVRTVEGETELMPGVRLVPLPGHTPGSQGVLVETAGGDYLVAGDCVSCHLNWDGDRLARHIPSGGFTDLSAYMASFAAIERLGCHVIPSHDPAVLKHDSFE